MSGIYFKSIYKRATCNECKNFLPNDLPSVDGRCIVFKEIVCGKSPACRYTFRILDYLRPAMLDDHQFADPVYGCFIMLDKIVLETILHTKKILRTFI